MWREHKLGSPIDLGLLLLSQELTRSMPYFLICKRRLQSRLSIVFLLVMQSGRQDLVL